MKALTVQQPYAHMIAIGEKIVENRSWFTEHRGLLAIHAGKSRERLELGDEETYSDMAFGAIVAVCELCACVTLESLKTPAWPMLDIHAASPHAEGPWCWCLKDIVALPLHEPWRVGGKNSLWTLPDHWDSLLEGWYRNELRNVVNTKK